MKRCLFVLFLLLSGAFGAGECCKFLWFVPDARTQATGGAGTAAPNIALAPYYNPASVSERKTMLVSAGNKFLDLDRRLYFASLVAGIKEGAGIGLVWIHTSTEGVEFRDIDGELLGTVQNGNDGIFFSFAKALVPGLLHLGLGVEYFQSSVENVTASSAGFGAGVSLRLRKYGVTFGAAAQNLFMRLSWNSNSFYGQGQVSNEDVPTRFRIGASYAKSFGAIPLQAAFDVWSVGDEVFLGGGIEVEICPERIGDEEAPQTAIPHIVLRAGVLNGKPTAGAGIRSKVGKIAVLGVDYAVAPESEKLAPQHTVQISVEY